MKKYIKDLTVKELHEYCKNQKSCHKCPLQKTVCTYDWPALIDLRKKVNL